MMRKNQNKPLLNTITAIILVAAIQIWSIPVAGLEDVQTLGRLIGQSSFLEINDPDGLSFKLEFKGEENKSMARLGSSSGILLSGPYQSRAGTDNVAAQIGSVTHSPFLVQFSRVPNGLAGKEVWNVTFRAEVYGCVISFSFCGEEPNILVG